LLLSIHELAADGDWLGRRLLFTVINSLEPPSDFLKREHVKVQKLLNSNHNLRILRRYCTQILLHHTPLIDVLITMKDKLSMQS
jgi:hypothetical protein